MEPDSSKQYRSITGKLVEERSVPTHTMQFSRPVRITPDQAAAGVDKKEEEVASCDLRNISKQEQRNRQKISNVGFVLSVAGVAFFIAYDQDVPRHYRLAMTGPFAVWIGYFLSAKAGICGMSKTGEWDPDNRGIRKAPKEIANKIWSKAKKVHAAQLLLPGLLSFLFYKSPI